MNKLNLILSVLLLLLPHTGVAELEGIEVSPFISADRKFIEFHIQNTSGLDASCSFIKVNVKYTSGAGGATIGQRVVSVRNVFVKAGALAFKQEAGKEHIAALEASFNDPQIADILGDVTYQCEPYFTLKTFTGRQASFVYPTALSTDGKYLVSGGGDSQISVWDTQTARLLQTIDTRPGPLKSRVGNIVFVPNTTHVVIADNQGISQWELTSQTKTWSDDFSINNARLVMNLSGDRVYLFSDEKTGFYEMGTKAFHLFSNSPFLSNVTFLTDGKTYLGSTNVGIAQIRDASTGNLLREIQPPERGYFVGLTPDEKSIVFQGEKFASVSVADLATGLMQTAPVLAPATIIVRGPYHVLPGGIVAFSDIRENNQGFIGLLDAKTGQVVRSIQYSENETVDRATTYSYSPDGKLVYLGMTGGQIRMVRLAN